jgi:hypothetical protein
METMDAFMKENKIFTKYIEANVISLEEDQNEVELKEISKS